MYRCHDGITASRIAAHQRHPTIGQHDLEGPVEVMIRPESIRLTSDAGAENRIIDRQFFGHDQVLTVRLHEGTSIRARTGPMPFDMAVPVGLTVESAQVFPSSKPAAQ